MLLTNAKKLAFKAKPKDLALETKANDITWPASRTRPRGLELCLLLVHVQITATKYGQR